MTRSENSLTSKIKSYWDHQPCGIKKGNGEIGTLEYFESGSRTRYEVEPHVMDFAGFHEWRGKRVLEIGCGMGGDAVQFAKHGADYTGIDISKKSIELAKKQFKVYGLHGDLRVINMADPEEIKQLEGDYDLVYSMGVIHHFPNIEQIIRNIHGLVAPGGEFRFMVYAKNSWKYAMIRKGLDQFEAQADCPFAQAYTSTELYDLLENSFEILRLRQAHCFMYNIDMYKQGKLELEPWFEAMPELVRDAVKEYLGWHLLIKARKI